MRPLATNAEFGQRVQFMRKLRKLSQSELAERAGFPSGHRFVVGLALLMTVDVKRGRAAAIT